MIISLAQINTLDLDISTVAKNISSSYTQATKKNVDLLILPNITLGDWWSSKYTIHNVCNQINTILKTIIKNTQNKKTHILSRTILSGERAKKLIDKDSGNIVSDRVEILAQDMYNATLLIGEGVVKKIYLRHINHTNTASFFATYVIDGHKIGFSTYDESDIELERYYTLDLIIMMGCTKYSIKGEQVVYQNIKSISDKYSVPIVYTNAIGAHDNMIFDGQSFILDKNGKYVLSTHRWQEQTLYCKLDRKSHNIMPIENSTNFNHNTNDLNYNTQSAKQKNWTFLSEQELFDLYHALVLGTKNYVKGTRFQKVLIGLSGGIDSALTAAIAVDALGPKNVLCCNLPSKFSSENSTSDAQELASRLGCEFSVIPIQSLHTEILSTLASAQYTIKETEIANENIQARLRSILLMAIANKKHMLLLNTGNKSENAIGYTTLYGDMCGALGVIGDVYKTQVKQLAHWRDNFVSKNHAQSHTQNNLLLLGDKQNIIGEKIINKAPSAELRAKQKDQTDLEMTYQTLDTALYGVLEKALEPNKICQMTNIGALDIERIINKMRISEFKRKQSTCILSVTKATLGLDIVLPLTTPYIEE
jgi:NAD+ synthase (glutamine-hydrolysing)